MPYDEEYIYEKGESFIEDGHRSYAESLAEIEYKLYKKYGLSQDEIKYIERTVRA